MATWPDCAFWRYSLALYGMDGVEAACLDLQRRHGLDVSMLLFACWLASLGVGLDRASAARAENAVQAWRDDVVRPLRALRERLARSRDGGELDGPAGRWPDHVAKLRSDVLALELDGEHLAQLALADIAADLIPADEPGPLLASGNLAFVQRFRSDDRNALNSLLSQAFPKAAPQALTEAVGSLAGPV